MPRVRGVAPTGPGKAPRWTTRKKSPNRRPELQSRRRMRVAGLVDGLHLARGGFEVKTGRWSSIGASSILGGQCGPPERSRTLSGVHERHVSLVRDGG